MTFLPFDIETAQLAVKANTGVVVTRDGTPVEITCWDTESPEDDWPVEGNILYPDCVSEESWTKEGAYCCSLDENHPLDIFIKTYLDI